MVATAWATLSQIKIGEEWKTVDANITTWNNNWTYRKADGKFEPATPNHQKVWRKHKTFAWKGKIDEDGAYIGYENDFDGFNWSNPDNQTNSEWINTATISLYDHFSNPIETTDINGNKASTKMGDKHSKIIATANAAYTDMYYSGAEYIEDKEEGYYEGHVASPHVNRRSTFAHTGNYSTHIFEGEKSFEAHVPANSKRNSKNNLFKVSVWVNKNNEKHATVLYDDEPIPFNETEKVYAGKWVQLNSYVTINSGGAKIAIGRAK